MLSRAGSDRGLESTRYGRERRPNRPMRWDICELTYIELARNNHAAIHAMMSCLRIRRMLRRSRACYRFYRDTGETGHGRVALDLTQLNDYGKHPNIQGPATAGRCIHFCFCPDNYEFEKFRFQIAHTHRKMN